MGAQQYKPLPTQSQLLESYRYEPHTGHIYWTVPVTGSDRSSHPTNMIKPLGYSDSSGYRKARVNKQIYCLHRLIWVMAYGQDPGSASIDHIDGDPSNNKLDNLRLVTQVVNCRNMVKSPRNTSGIMGVRWNKNSKSWQVSISAKTIGYHKDFFEACCARKSAEVKLGYHINHGRAA